MFSSSQRQQFNTDGYYQEGQIAATLKACNVKVGGEIDTHYLIFCPFHYNVRTPACEIDKTSGMFHCFACGESGHLIVMVMQLTNRTYFEAVRLISSFQQEENISDTIENLVDSSNEIEEFDVNLINKLHENLINNDRAVEYFYSRNIMMESILKFKLGYSEKQDMVTVPITDKDGIFMGFVGRSIEGKSFKNSTGLAKSKTLFNLNNTKYQKIVVVESSFDVIRLDQVGVNAVATLGATISRTQIELLQKYAKEVLVCPDNDDAGKKLEEKIDKYLGNKFSGAIRLNHGKDVGDLTNKEIVEKFNDVGNTLVLGV